MVVRLATHHRAVDRATNICDSAPEPLTLREACAKFAPRFRGKLERPDQLLRSASNWSVIVSADIDRSCDAGTVTGGIWAAEYEYDGG